MRKGAKGSTNYRAMMQRAHLKREIVETLLFVALIFVIVHFSIQTFRIPDASMHPALQPDELVVVNKAAYVIGSPARGDVVVFFDPTDPKLQNLLIERVIGVPGDTITITPSSVILDGVTLKEPYVSLPVGGSENARIIPSLKLGPNQYFVMNDFRGQSPDSRTFGAIDRRNIIGKAVLVFWPLSHFGGVSDYSSVFAGIGK